MLASFRFTSGAIVDKLVQVSFGLRFREKNPRQRSRARGDCAFGVMSAAVFR